MIRSLFCSLCIMLSSLSWAQSETSLSLLDNRFRVDPTIEQISFVIYRENPSRSAVLVRPDGKKYYAWDHPENVSWYEESGMDIVSLNNPMPGPWQAVGKITPKNSIRLLSNLALNVDKFPARLYQDERLKFTARLTQDGQPLVLRDFLDRVRLKVNFIQFVEDTENPELTKEPVTATLGSFADDGIHLDEVSGDGVFTVEIPISVAPGKYRAIITSGNGVFLRAVEQTVLVYPSPMTVSFIQSREESEGHIVSISGEQGMVLPGTMAATVEQITPDKRTLYSQGRVNEDGNTVELSLTNDPAPGRHTWKGMIYATEGAANRELVFHIEEQAFSVMEKLDIESSTKEYQRLQEEKRKALEIERIKRDREEARMSGMLSILVGNLVVIVLGLVVWFIVGKLRIRKVSEPAMQLNMPPKE